MSVRPSTNLSPDVCTRCRRPFVVPIEVLDFTQDRFLVELGCSNCGRREIRLHDDSELERLDRALDDGIALIADALQTAELTRELEEIDTFARALHAGAIIPEDF